MKLVVLLIFVLLPWISIIGDWALKWTEGNEELQVGFVMLFFPVVMNATQYYIIDTFIKDRSGASDDGVLGSDDEDSGSDLEDEVEGLLGDQEAVTVKHKSAHRHQASTDYDESRDGAVESTELSPSRASKLLTENDEFEASRSR